MLKETILTVQTCDLKVDINCQGCVKKIKKILQKIDGVYQTNVDGQQGKVTITGQMDMDTVFKKLKKGSMSAQFWEANSTEEIEESSGGTNDATMVLPPQVTPTPEQDLSNNIQQQIEQRLQMLNGEKLPPQPIGMPAAINSGGNNQSGKKIGGGANDPVPRNAINDNTGATIVLPPQVTPTPEQHLPSIQQQIELRLRMLNGEKLPPQPKGMPPGGMQISGKKICGSTVPGNASNDVGKKLYQDAGGSQVKNGVIGQPPHNGALLLGSLNNNHGQAKRDIGVGVGSQMMGGTMAPQKRGMMRPTNNMIGPTSLPGMGKIGGMPTGPYPNYDGYNMQPYGGNGAIHGPGMQYSSSLPRVGFYPSGGGSSGMEMMQQVARNPTLQQPYMMVQPQQEHEIRMHAHFPHSQNAHYGPGYTGYQLMGYDNGHGHLQQQYAPPTYYPMPLPPQDDNIFSDGNPNICSLM